MHNAQLGIYVYLYISSGFSLEAVSTSPMTLSMSAKCDAISSSNFALSMWPETSLSSMKHSMLMGSRFVLAAINFFSFTHSVKSFIVAFLFPNTSSLYL